MCVGQGRTLRGCGGGGCETPQFFDKPSVKIKMVSKMVIIFDNYTLVGKITVIIISSYKDTLVGSKILVSKMEMIIISFYKVSLVLKCIRNILIMVSATLLWSVTYFARLNGNTYYQFLQKLVGR